MSDFNFSCICHAIIFNRYSRILICRYNKRRTIIMRSPSHRLTVTVTVIICTICRPLNCIINYTHINLLFGIQKSTSKFDVLSKPYLKFLICLLFYYITKGKYCNIFNAYNRHFRDLLHSQIYYRYHRN